MQTVMASGVKTTSGGEESGRVQRGAQKDETEAQ
jgi:hypothetical protein